jgi:hypothetical protein
MQARGRTGQCDGEGDGGGYGEWRSNDEKHRRGGCVTALDLQRRHGGREHLGREACGEEGRGIYQAYVAAWIYACLWGE